MQVPFSLAAALELLGSADALVGNMCVGVRPRTLKH